MYDAASLTFAVTVDDFEGTALLLFVRSFAGDFLFDRGDLIFFKEAGVVH